MTAERDRLAALIGEFRRENEVHATAAWTSDDLADRLIAAGVGFTDGPLTSEEVWRRLEADPAFVAAMERGKADFEAGRVHPYYSRDLDVERLARALQHPGVEWPKRWTDADFAWIARQVAAAYREDAG